MIRKQCSRCFICFEIKGRKASEKDYNEGSYCSVYCYHKSRSESKRQKFPQCKVHFVECLWCGKLFCNHNSSKYCSDECRKEIEVAKRAERYAGRKKSVGKVKCKECGIVFYNSYGVKASKFCSIACGKKHNGRTSKAKRRAITRGVFAQKINPIDIFNRDKWKCGLCGQRTLKGKRGTTHSRAPELDHIIPLSVGGDHSYHNVQCSCRSCNSNKGASRMGQMRMC